MRSTLQLAAGSRCRRHARGAAPAPAARRASGPCACRAARRAPRGRGRRPGRPCAKRSSAWRSRSGRSILPTSCISAPTPRSSISSSPRPKTRPISSEITATFIACALALSPALQVSRRMHMSPSTSILSSSARVRSSVSWRACSGCATTLSKRRAPGLAGFVELALAQLGRGALRAELLAALAFGGLGGGLAAAARWPRRPWPRASSACGRGSAAAPARSSPGSSAAASGPGRGSCRSAARG